MTADALLSRLAAHVGVFAEFTDMEGKVHATSPDTQRAMLRANGLAVETEAEVKETLATLQHEAARTYVPQDVIVTCRKATTLPLAGTVNWIVRAEASGDVLAEGKARERLELPALPMGVHSLQLKGDAGTQTANLISAPARVPSLPELTGQDKTWGVVAALYGISRNRTQGVGDFDDLAALAEVLGAQGAGFLGINPVHALGWAAANTISPYSPTHRGFLNTAHLATETPLPGSQDPAAPLLDYPAHVGPHRLALQEEFGAFQVRASASEKQAFDAFCRSGGQALRSFATFEALSEIHGPDWRFWPPELQRASDEAAAGVADRAPFHMWLQWRADAQLLQAQQTARQSGMALGLYLDLAVGARLGGAESWGQGAASAIGVSLGAPPDQLSPAGQNWQLTALSPHKLQQGGYAAFRQILAQTLRHCGVLRIDHALGLNRSYWLPEDGSPGGYIRQPFRALMAVIAIEATRAGSVIVGEDLGLVPKGFRETMAEGGLYGYTVLQYEKDASGAFLPDERLRAQSLACFGTHDTPTLRGFWEARDIDWWEKLMWIDSEGAEAARTRRWDEKRHLLGLPRKAALPDLTAAAVRDKVHGRLARTPAALVAVQLDDILTVTEAQNLPGTVDTHPNWRRRMPATIAEIATSEDLATTARLMAQAGRASVPQKLRKESK